MAFTQSMLGFDPPWRDFSINCIGLLRRKALTSGVGGDSTHDAYCSCAIGVQCSIVLKLHLLVKLVNLSPSSADRPGFPSCLVSLIGLYTPDRHPHLETLVLSSPSAPPYRLSYAKKRFPIVCPVQFWPNLTSVALESIKTNL